MCDEILIVSESAVGFHEPVSFRGFSRAVFNSVVSCYRTVQLYVARTVQVSTGIIVVDKKLKTPFLRPQSFFSYEPEE